MNTLKNAFDSRAQNSRIDNVFCPVRESNAIEVRCREFSDNAFHTLTAEGYQPALLKGPICRDCYQEMREVLIEASAPHRSPMSKAS